MKKVFKDETKNKIRKGLKIAGKTLCYVLAVAIVITAIVMIFLNLRKGNIEQLGSTTKKSYATRYSQVKLSPSGDMAGRYWRDGMIGGNGKLGFVTSGSPYSDTIIYQDVDFIMPTDRDRNYLPDLYKDLETARQSVINMDDSFVCADCMNWNYNYAFHPGHQLRLQSDGSIFFKDYIRWTDYETGEVGVSYSDKNGTWSRKTFTSRTDDVTITSIAQSSEGLKVNMTLSIDDISSMFKFGDGDEKNVQYKKIVDDNCNYIAQVMHYPDYEKSSLYNGGCAGVTYVVVVGGQKEKVLLENTNESENVGNEQNPAIKITDADAVYLITKSDRDFNMGSFDSFKDSNEYALINTLVNDCKTVSEKYQTENKFDYSKALKPSAEEQKKLFNTVSFSLGEKDEADKFVSNERLLLKQRLSTKLSDAMIERIYNQARYAMVCSSGYTMTRLSGMWTGEWNPGWRSMYTMDANVNLQSSGMNTANLEQFGEGYINFILRQIDDWKINAQKLYGMNNAIVAPVNTDGDGALAAEYCLDYPFQYWNAGASWMLQPIYEFWQCYGNMTIKTDEGDKDLEKDILLPLLTMQSNFWQELCTPEYYMDASGNACYEKGKTALNEDETYLIIPSYSPENHTLGDYESTIAANSAIDIAAAKDGLKMTIEIEKQTKTDGWELRVAALENLLNNLPKYMYDETGAIKEWSIKQFGENNDHRHISHLYCAWPAFDTQGNEELTKACLQALENRKAENTASHGWVHKGLVNARLKNSPVVYNSLYTLLHSKICYDSLMTDHNTNRGSNTYCTDTEFGIVGIIDEALLYSNTGEIDIFPALPDQWAKGSVSGLMARTNATVSITWENRSATAVIKSLTDQTISVSCSGNETKEIYFNAGEEKTLEFNF